MLHFPVITSPGAHRATTRQLWIIQCLFLSVLHYLFMVFNEDLHHNVLELDIHDGGDGLLLRPH